MSNLISLPLNRLDGGVCILRPFVQSDAGADAEMFTRFLSEGNSGKDAAP